MRWIDHGWDNDVLVVNEEWVFRRPLNARAQKRLLSEPPPLRVAKRRVSLCLPDLVLHHTPFLFSEHRMVPGETMDGERYRRLPAAAQAQLADDLAGAYAQMHAVPIDEALGAGCRMLPRWPAPQVVERSVLARLHEAKNVTTDGDVKRIVADYAAAEIGIDRLVFGQFDAHGWNMAFDNCQQRLTGLFDFAGAGVGPLHVDLCYPAFVDDALLVATVARYNAKTGRCADVHRARAAFGMLRCLELLDAQPPLQPYIDALLRVASVARD